MPYILDYEFNGQTALSERLIFGQCDACGMTNRKWDEPFDLGRKPFQGRRDISMTTDVFTIVSPRFKAALDEYGVAAVEYRPLSCGFFVLLPTTKVSLDLANNNVRPGKVCVRCGQSEGMLATLGQEPEHPAIILVDEPRIQGPMVVRSRQEIGIRGWRSPVFIVSNEVGSLLLDQKLVGWSLRQCHQSGIEQPKAAPKIRTRFPG